MNAQEARQQAENAEIVKKEISGLIQSISTEAHKGGFEIRINKMHTLTQKWAKENGYKVLEFKNYDETFFRIHWF